MPPAKPTVSNSMLRNLPSVDVLLHSTIAQHLLRETGETHTVKLMRRVIDEIRREIIENPDGLRTEDSLLNVAEEKLRAEWKSEQMAKIRRVINATGVVIHTNLGRAPLSEMARRALFDEASGYCTLEYDLETGKRGHRGLRAEDLLAELTGAESALIVNNCAAAAFFVLTVFASAGEVIISRGELVEIGGDFRVPDVLTQSGATLREVGTTNRTKLADYEKAINDKTRLILRVHPSNYKIVGFTATPTISELADLSHRHNLLIYEDIGSGALVDLSGVGLDDEPVVANSISAGVDVVTFSGDKLLGGPQSGIIAGKRDLIDRLRKHPLYRALRVDKLIYAALEATLDQHRRGTAATEIPVLNMLAATPAALEKRTLSFIESLSGKLDERFKLEPIPGNSAIGGGAGPMSGPPTTLIALSHKTMTAATLEKSLRNASPPVIARIAGDRLLLDLRTVSTAEESELSKILIGLSAPDSNVN